MVECNRDYTGYGADVTIRKGDIINVVGKWGKYNIQQNNHRFIYYIFLFFCYVFYISVINIIFISDSFFIGRKSYGAFGFFSKDFVKELPGN